MATDSAIRITIRVEIPGSTYTTTRVDLAIPQHSSIAEILDEVLALAGAPSINRPWQATTAAGVLIDAAEPLLQTQLTHGSTLILSPHREVEPPVVCDAAESLASHTTGHTPTGLGTVATFAGIVLALCCALSPSLAQRPTGQLPLGLRLAAVAALSFGIMVRIRSANAEISASGSGTSADSSGRAFNPAAVSLLAAACIGCGSAATLAFIVGFPLSPTAITDVPWVGVVVASVGIMLLAACHVLGGLPLRFSVACATSLMLVGHSTLAFAVSSNPASIAAATCALAVVTVALAPWLSVHLAGLKIPRLPSPGQDYNVTDLPVDNPQRRARRATAILDGILMGTASCAAPAMIILGTRGDGYAAALCLATTGAVLAHAIRHRSTYAVWALWLWSMTSVAALGVCVLYAGNSVALLLITTACALTTTSTCLWAHLLGDLSPTALNWVERIESLAVAATIPLAAHILGVFALIRGLG